MPRLLTIFGNQHCILYLRYMLATFTKESQIEQRSVWCLVNPELCNKEGAFSRSTTRTNWEAKNLFHSSQCTQEGKKEKCKSILDRFRRCQLHGDSQINTGVRWKYLYSLWRWSPAEDRCRDCAKNGILKLKETDKATWKLRAELCQVRMVSPSDHRDE